MLRRSRYIERTPPGYPMRYRHSWKTNQVEPLAATRNSPPPGPPSLARQGLVDDLWHGPCTDSHTAWPIAYRLLAQEFAE